MRVYHLHMQKFPLWERHSIIFIVFLEISFCCIFINSYHRNHLFVSIFRFNYYHICFIFLFLIFDEFQLLNSFI